jgi:capsular exopolysaccharide synthesis family protein
MSRIQNILEKAEREGATLRTSGVAVQANVTVPVTADLGRPPAPGGSTVITPGALSQPPASGAAVASSIAGEADSLTVRLSPMLVAGLAPASPAAEQYRGLRTRLGQAENGTALRSMLVTSPLKGEGKSITAANLALTMAQELHRRVVIVEADLRKPSLQQLFGLPPGPGLAEFLMGAADLKDVMKFLPEYHLTVVPGGGAPMNPAELLGSTAMRRLLEHLRTRFDRVILDTPPVLPLADVAVLAPLVDAALLVVRAGFTPRPALENALRGFDASRLVGVILNESGMEDDYRYEEQQH